MGLVKIVVVSDTHGNVKALEQLRQIFIDSDYIVHLGDGARDMKDFYSEFGNKIYQVDGNCDVFASSLKEFILEIGKVKILLTHGDLFGVKTGRERLINYAMKKGCNAVFYGHTHNQEISLIDGITVVNPGTLSYFASEKTFAYVVINDEKIVATINKTTVKQ